MKESATSSLYLYLCFIILLYVILSIWEWSLHKFFLHNMEFHMKHHTHDELEGLTFDYFSPLSFLPNVLIGTIITFSFAFVFPQVNIVILALIYFIYYTSFTYLFNSMHVFMAHDHFNIKRKYFGSAYTFGKLLKWFPSLNFLIKNHEKHHETLNSNYNVVFPFADFLFGTYKQV